MSIKAAKRKYYKRNNGSSWGVVTLSKWWRLIHYDFWEADCYLWGATACAEFPHRVIQLAYERGLESFGQKFNPYKGAEAVAWIRGHYLARDVEHDHLIDGPRFNIAVKMLPALEVEAEKRMKRGKSDPSATRRQGNDKSTAQAAKTVGIGPLTHIHDLGKAWGKHMRSSPNGWHKTNSLVRHFEVGSGHNYVRSAYTSDSITSGSQRSYVPTSDSGQLSFGTDNWRISGSSPSSDCAAFHRNLFDMSIKDMRIFKSTIPISEFMSKELQWFHRAWLNKLPFRYQAMIWTHYVPTVDHSQKLALLHTTDSSYRACLAAAQRELHTQICVLQLNVKTPLPANKYGPTKEQVAPLWATRILASVHKCTGQDSNVPSSIIDDDNCYFRRVDGTLYSVLSRKQIRKLRRRNELKSFLMEQRQGPGELCHFPAYLCAKLTAGQKYNTDSSLNELGLTHFDSGLAQWWKQDQKHQVPGRRTINGCYSI